MRRKIPNTPITYTRTVPNWKNVLSKHAIYRYSYGNQISNMLKKYIMRHMKIQNYNGPLYRGLRNNQNITNFNTKNTVKRNWFSSFSKNAVVANSYTKNKKRRILVINNPKRIRSVNYVNYKSEYPGEVEVLLPPGVFTVKRRNKNYIHVNFKDRRARV